MMGRLKHGALFVFCFSVVTLLFYLHTLGHITNKEAGEAPSLMSDLLSLGSNVNSVLEKEVAVNQFCGYQSCPKTKPGLVNVHLVAHSHDDVGWLSTADEYYSGSTNSVHNVSVAKIIDSVVDQLLLDPSRRFIYAEMAFFQRWWNQQKEDRRDVVRDLVANGRLEFINGGWCMNDEGSTHYIDIIDQMSLGLDFLNKTFGECGRPKVAWQIDPFGHSKEHASLVAQMGFDGMFLSRIDFQDKNQRMSQKTMEMIWSGSNSLGDDGEIMTGVLYDHYTAPPGFCFDEKSHAHCHDPTLSELDLEKRVSAFLNFTERQTHFFRTNNIMITMGHDFTYQNASTWFAPMDILIKHANKRQENGSKFNLFYSTPACYLKALNDHNKDAVNKTSQWPKKTDDFFPYGSTLYEYWTGYFTSRPTLKYMVRQGSNLLQSCKQMASALTGKEVNYDGDIWVMKRAMGTMQHHDAVTGTEKQRVADDYAQILHKGVEECQKIQNSFYRKMLPKTSKVDLEVSFCQLNMSQCYLTENTDQFIVNVYNPLPRTVDKYIRIPVNHRKQASAFQVMDSNGKSVMSELVPLPEFVKNLAGRISQASIELVFLASQLPPLGSRSFHISSSMIDSRLSSTMGLNETLTSEDLIISNKNIGIKIDGLTGLMKSIISADGKESLLQQEFLWYPSGNGSDGQNRRPSGAYMFRPTTTYAIPIKKSKGPAVKTFVYQGELVQEVHQYHNEWIGQVIRLYKGVDHVEFDWIVGPIPVEDDLGKEVITRFNTDFSNGDVFYTDANGRQTIKRRIDWRESFKYETTEPVAGNYYPVNSHIYIRDSSKERQLTILVDRSQGGSCLKEGQLELMVHRRPANDDGNGIGEVLNEVAHGRGLIARGTHYLILSETDQAAKSIISLSRNLNKQPQISFYETNLPYKKWSKLYNREVKLLNRDLSENVDLLTLEPRSDGNFLLRLEHIVDDVDKKTISTVPAVVPLKGLFNGFEITSIQETMLGGNEWKNESQRLVWRNNQDFPTVNTKSLDDIEGNLTVLLNPMQIRTFIISLISLKK